LGLRIPGIDRSFERAIAAFISAEEAPRMGRQQIGNVLLLAYSQE
jgi:hypothetical protein